MFIKKCILFILLLTFSVHAEVRQQLHIAVSEYPPYTTQDLKHFGIDSRVVSRAFEIMGIEVIYDFLPTSRAFKMAQSGAYIATMPWAKREGREKFFYYSDPLIESDTEYFYFLKQNPVVWNNRIKDYNQIAHLNVAAILEYNYGEAFMEAEHSKLLKVSRLNSEAQAFRHLLHQRVDLFISQKRVGDYTLQKYFSKEQQGKIGSVMQTLPRKTSDYVLFTRVNPQSQYFLEQFNKGLQRLKRSGEYTKIIKTDFEKGYYLP